MAACKALLDPLGSLEQPVHCRIECIGTGALDVQLFGKRRLPQRSAGKEFGTRLDNALRDHREDQVTLLTRFAIDQLGQFEAFDHRQDRFHVPVRQRSLDSNTTVLRKVCSGLVFCSACICGTMAARAVGEPFT